MNTSNFQIQEQLQKFRKEFHKKIAKKQGIHLKETEINLKKSDDKIQKIVRQRLKQLKSNYFITSKILLGGGIFFLIYQIAFIFFLYHLQ